MSLIEQYLQYTNDTEPPKNFHRWCCISAIGAMLGRNVYFEHGRFKINPNLYCMLLGVPGTRKTTSIQMVKKVITAAGYSTIAATKTTKEKFLLDLEGVSDDEVERLGNTGSGKGRGYAQIETAIFGSTGEVTDPRECFVMADEFNEFIGINNLEFLSTLGTFWDWDDDKKPFESRIKTGRSTRIYQPTVSILGGNTAENFNTAFPPEILGQGFFSRLLLIHGDRSDRFITFPEKPSDAATAEIVARFTQLRQFHAKVQLSSEAAATLDEIYKTWKELTDTRFVSYSNRRFSHLLKLCVIVAADEAVTNPGEVITLQQEAVVRANTYLTAAEFLMPRALGEFGAAKNSHIVNKIVEYLKTKDAPVDQKQLYLVVRRDLNKPGDLPEILNGMLTTGTLTHISQKGYLVKTQLRQTPKYVNWDFLTEEEMKGIRE